MLASYESTIISKRKHVALRTDMLMLDRDNLHHYRDGGHAYFSVSQVMTVLTGERFYKDDEALQRGSLVHQWCAEWVLNGAIGPALRGESVRPYCSAYAGWWHKHDRNALRVETAGRNKRLGYAGTPDLIWSLNRTEGVTLTDIKTGAPQWWHALQVQMYDRLDGIRAGRLSLLYLKKDGTYKEVPVERKATDWAAILGALAVLKRRAQEATTKAI